MTDMDVWEARLCVSVAEIIPYADCPVSNHMAAEGYDV